MKGYYKITLQVQCFDYRRGNHTVEVEAVARGLLAIHPRLTHAGLATWDRTRVITHIPSGRMVGKASGIRAACHLLDQMLDAADWRTAHLTGFTSEQREQLTRICSRIRRPRDDHRTFDR